MQKEVPMILPSSKEGKAIPENKILGKKIKTGIWKKQEVEYVEGEILLKVPPGKDKDSSFMKRIFSGDLKNAKIKRAFDRFGLSKITVDDKVDIMELCAKLNENKVVEYAEPNFVDKISATVPNDTLYPQQWHHPLINSPDAWDVETGNNSVLVTILDSGIPMTGSPATLSHPDLSDPTRILLGPDLVNGDAFPRDDCGHGTHVAGLASAQSNNSSGVTGMSWGNRLYIVKVFNEYGLGSSDLFHDGVVDAVDYAQAHGYTCIINYSGGGSASTTKENAVIYAQSHNCLLVAAAGNDNGGAVRYPAAYSAAYNNVIAISATDSTDTFAGYSNKGPEINVCAPGTNVYSTMPNYPCFLTTSSGHSQDYDYLDGTSMSTPLVSGLAALIWSYDASLTPGEVRDTIESNAVDLGPAGWDQEYGYGRINASASMEDISEPTYCFYVTEGGCLFKREGCLFAIEYGDPCIYKKEFCVYKMEFTCKYITEAAPCIARYEAIPCHISTEIGGYCTKISEIGCLREICTRELPQGMCTRESGYIGPDELIIKEKMPQAQKAVTAKPKRFRHMKPMTKAFPLAHKKRYLKK